MDDGRAHTDLGLEIEELDFAAVVRPGRRSQPVTVSIVRPIRTTDLVLLATERGVKPEPLKKVTERHHALARLLAAGSSEGEAAAIIGYDLSRVSVLKRDPAFAELISFYRSSVDTEFAATMAQIAGLSKDILLELRERLENEPEGFTNRDLQGLLRDALDRSGYGPTSTQVNLNADLGTKINEARQRAKAARLAQIRDVTPKETDDE